MLCRRRATRTAVVPAGCWLFEGQQSKEDGVRVTTAFNRLLALRVRRHGRRGDIELPSDVLDDVARNISGIGEKRADESDRRQLHSEAKPVVIATATTHETQIAVVEEEEALQLHPRRHTREPAVRAGLDIGEELDRQRRLNVPIGLLKRLAPDPVPLFLTGLHERQQAPDTGAGARGPSGVAGCRSSG